MEKYIYVNEYGKSIEFSMNSIYKLTEIDGLSDNSIKLDTASSNVSIGEQVTDQSVSSKVLTFEGDFKESHENRRKLIDTIVPTVKGVLNLIDEKNGLDVFIEVYPKKTPYISKTKVYQKFQFELMCPFPYWKTTKKSIYDFFSYDSLFELPRSFSNTIPWKISTRIMRNIVNVYNDSSIESGFTIKIKALSTITAPEVIDIKSQKRIKMNDDFILNTDEILYIYNYDNDLRIIKVSGVKEINAFGDLDVDVTEFYKLKVGDNILKVSSLQNESQMDVTIEFDDVLAGV